MHGIGAHLDASADFAQLWCLFVNVDVVAGFQKAAGSGEPAESCTCNNNFTFFHVQFLVSAEPFTCQSLIINLYQSVYGGMITPALLSSGHAGFRLRQKSRLPE